MGVILLGLLANPTVRTALWTIALGWMGTACILNAQRCGRTHCRYTGPYYLAMIVPVGSLWSSALADNFYGWLVLGTLIIAGSKLIWWATERKFGHYI